MRKSFISAIILAGTIFPMTANRDSYEIYVDKHGVMRRSDTKEEVAYYGTNYTLPFAHAYRAAGYVGADRKSVIDLDVKHMKRLGLNGFRLHLWDAELADSAGNIISNEHLDLLDYMISRLEKEGIDIVLTAQTNFGNGYPERNIDTGAFTYDFEKCKIHEDPRAQQIQENYLYQLMSHINPYTGKSYGEDKAIIAIEINNEPCHSGSGKEVTAYINRMVKALRKGGFDRIALYNVSHNPDVTEAYYDADIQGTTYQWYPVGLVAGHQRKGNFLPYVDSYDIPWKNSIKRYGNLARFVYEFDPGDVVYTHLYPAVARTFRKEGFQWATQFAYDPTPIAAFNTEYQTHFLNLLYTPGKAISMMIAGEVMRQIPRGADYGTYPGNADFGDFSVSYDPDLATLNAPDKFYHTSSTPIAPVAPDSLRYIAGVGNSSIVAYPGTGAYFLDNITTRDGIAWRLEILPDVALISDPFMKTSLKKPVGALYYASHPIKLSIPGLNKDFHAISITGNHDSIIADDGTFVATPGVYLIGNNMATLEKLSESDPELADYSAPKDATAYADKLKPLAHVSHQSPQNFDASSPLRLEAKVLSDKTPAKVAVYPSTVSFWNNTNPLVEMSSSDGVNFYAEIPTGLHHGNSFSYNIVVEDADGNAITYPAASSGSPLDWDVATTEYYTSSAANPDAPVILLSALASTADLDYALLPSGWNGWYSVEHNAPISPDRIVINSTPDSVGTLILRHRLPASLDSPALKADSKTEIAIKTGKRVPNGTRIAFTNRNGESFAALLADPQMENGDFVYTLPLSALSPTRTQIIPAPYPTFLGRTADVRVSAQFNPSEIEFVELRIPTLPGEKISLPITYILLK